MKIIKTEITLNDLKEMAGHIFDDMVKAVVDVRTETLAVDAELHSDLEQMLLSEGSQQSDLWGINLYPSFFGQAEFLEFDSMINLKPAQGNKSRGIDDTGLRGRISALVKKRVLAA